MNKQKTIEGLWHIFGKDRPPCYGVLSYDPETGLELDTKTFDEIEESVMMRSLTNEGRPKVESVIIGFDQGNQPITLYDCFVCGNSPNRRLQALKISSSFATAGRAFESWDEIQADHIFVNYTLLDNWMDKKIMDSVLDKDGNPAFKVASYSEIATSLDNGSSAKIFSTSQVSWSRNQETFTGDHCIEFKFPRKISIKNALSEYAEGFRRFLTLLIGELVFIEQVTFHPDDKKGPHSVELLQNNHGIKNANRDIHALFMLVNFRDIKTDFNGILNRWLGLRKKFDVVIDLYFATLKQTLYVEVRFLLLAQALEVYHRKSHKGPEKKLADRLREIANTHIAFTGQFIDDIGAFSEKVANARNYFTHYDNNEIDMNEETKQHEVISLADCMQALVEICLLSDLGISGKPIFRLIERLKAREIRKH
jgi:hypothetical protein